MRGQRAILLLIRRGGMNSCKKGRDPTERDMPDSQEKESQSSKRACQIELGILLTEFGRLAGLREIGLMLLGISVVYLECLLTALLSVMPELMSGECLSDHLCLCKERAPLRESNGRLIGKVRHKKTELPET